MTKAQKMRTFTKAYSNWRSIEDDRDLRRNKLTLAEYNMLTEILKSLSDISDKVEETISESVANWCRKRD